MAEEGKWFAEMALKVESFYVKNSQTIDRVAGIGRIWGTRVEDLKSPIGVAGRILRTVPEVVSLARTFTAEPNAVYAQAILQQELPHLVIGALEVDSRRYLQTASNPNTSHLKGLLRGLAAVLTLKTEEVALFHETAGKVDIAAFKVHLGNGVVLGHLLRVNTEYAPIHGPLLSSHSAEETQEALNLLWEKEAVVGLEIKSSEAEGSNRRIRSSFDDCEIHRIQVSDDLVVGNEFANDYLQIARRVRRFEEAGYKRNLMLLGPPGCGKTSIAQQIAREIGRFTINVESNLLASSVLIQVLTTFFRDVVLICDDFDRYYGDTQSLLASLERTGSSLIVTCNTVYGFDKAAIRVGRIDEIIRVPKPDSVMRKRLFQHFYESSATHQSPFPDAEQLEAILQHTEGFTPAEMREVAKCYDVLGFDDSKLEIKRLRRQSKLAESLGYRVDWANMQSKDGQPDASAPTEAEPSDGRRVFLTPDVDAEDDEDDDW